MRIEMKILNLVVAVLILTLSFTTFGAAKGVTANFTVGRPVIVSFDDGREAQVFNVAGVNETTENVYFRVSDNTCTDFYDGRKINGKPLDLKCSFEIPKIDAGIVLLWTKNPDPTKVGQRVSIKDSDLVLQSLVQVGALEFALAPYRGGGRTYQEKQRLVPENLMPKIVCKDYRWLPGVKDAGTPVDSHIQRWSKLEQDRNSETGDLETRQTDQTDGVNLKVIQENKLLFSFKNHFQYGDSAYGYFKFDPVIPSTYYGFAESAMQLGLLKNDSEACSIGLTRVVKTVQKTSKISESTDSDYLAGTVTPYIYSEVSNNNYPQTEDPTEQRGFVLVLEYILKQTPGSDFE